MACPAIITGDQFLLRTLAHIDCQAQLIGSYGYLALSEPGSLAALVMTGLLTLFIALFGLRVMFGPQPGARDLVGDVLKIGIVLTLAFSWPAFRTLIYDVTLNGPAEVASVIATSSHGQASGAMVERLQQADDAMVALTARGTGRNTGQLIDDERPGDTFAGAALQDESTLGWARLAFLAGTIGGLALLRIAAGLLLALAPLAAGLLLFAPSRGLFAGWLKGLVLTLIGSIGASIVLSVELAVLEPWLADAMRVRELGYAVPSAPIELLAMTLAFAIVQWAMIWLLARVAFHRGWLDMPHITEREAAALATSALPQRAVEPIVVEARAARLSGQVETLMRREEYSSERHAYRGLNHNAPSEQSGTYSYDANDPQRLGSSFRRVSVRHSRAAIRRDRTP